MSLHDVKRVWQHLGRRDPYWGVLSDPAKKGTRWRTEGFCDTGREEIGALMDHLARYPELRGRAAALDFGCGPGRLSQALAEHYATVVGVDIAESMVELAERHNRHSGRCRYVVNTREDLSLFEDGTFDLVYSSITLQHVEPRSATRYIAEFVRILKPGGALVFQLPSERKDASEGAGGRSLRRRLARAAPEGLRQLVRSVRTRLRLLLGHTFFECWEVPRATVEKVLEGAGGRILEISPDASGGPDVNGYRYLATKPAPRTAAG